MASLTDRTLDRRLIDGLLRALNELPGIQAATLAPDHAGGWGMLNLSLEEGTDETGVAIAVGHLLKERFGLGVDLGAIALVEDISPMSPIAGVEGGVAVELLTLSTAARTVSCRVALRSGQRTAEVSSSTTTGHDALVRLVAETTLEALVELHPEIDGCEIESIQVGNSDAGPVVRVVCMRPGPTGRRRFVGRAALVSDPRQATVRAVLRALAPLVAPVPAQRAATT